MSFHINLLCGTKLTTRRFNVSEIRKKKTAKQDSFFETESHEKPTVIIYLFIYFFFFECSRTKSRIKLNAVY